MIELFVIIVLAILLARFIMNNFWPIIFLIVLLFFLYHK